MFSQARQELYATIVSVLGEGHVTHMSWIEGEDPPLPWAAYYDEPEGDGADNANWCVRHLWSVELHERESDSVLEASLFEALAEAYGYVEPPTGAADESDGHYICVYRFSEIERM